MRAGSNQLSAVPHVLFVDDEIETTRVLFSSLKRRGADFTCQQVLSAEAAIDALPRFHPNVVVVDLSLDSQRGPESGLELIGDILVLDSTLRVLVLTGHHAEDYGIKALQQGAASFLTKPVDTAHLLALIRDGISCSKLKRDFEKLKSSSVRLQNVSGLSSRSPKMLNVLETLSYAAQNNQAVLLIGETGTGKGVIAQAIHQSSARRHRPFIRCQPTFRNQDLVTSEIFGHRKGAFTGATENRQGLLEKANTGTLFIDEVDELPLETQIHLLNVLQEKIFRPLGTNKEMQSNFRLITATNCPIEQALSQKKIRPDFYHRIAHIVLNVPPLRERIEDLPDLAESFLRRMTNAENLAVQGFEPGALSRLSSYAWPGNIRELQAIVEGGVYRAHFLKRHFVKTTDFELPTKSKQAEGNGQSFHQRVEHFKSQLVAEAMARYNDNQTQAADSLQLDRNTIRRIVHRTR